MAPRGYMFPARPEGGRGLRPGHRASGPWPSGWRAPRIVRHAAVVGLTLTTSAAGVETIGVVTLGTVYLMAELGSGALASGITGAELRLDGMPAACR